MIIIICHFVKVYKYYVEKIPKTSEKSHIIGMIVVIKKYYKLKMTLQAGRREGRINTSRTFISIHSPHKSLPLKNDYMFVLYVLITKLYEPLSTTRIKVN